MGAEGFVTYQAGTDAQKAFEGAVEDARYEYGNRGYTGTIAEKDDFTVVTTTPMPLNEANEYAGRLLDADDSRVSDKRGPAGAVPVLTGERTVELIITTADAPPGGFEGSYEDAARALLTARGMLAEGEEVAYGVTGSYELHPITRRPYTGTMKVPLVNGPLKHTGWLFFGVASC
ncbi:hypothetical protein CLM85_12835 [Streptomyces albidoflavus]|uniref:hypothetical protein n=3 Tax=Streptomyces albidoflavus TaxID=1886 RepID=UPI000BAE27FB|nr:hypothetical protein [Streptomyces albidoflavus]PAX88491.1 hypothetical protein CLM82_24070 [Streptomyces albidoflavus]PBO20354.1 hypothetical protein CLM83_01020 [Streptomyces albidoflavus]PBO23994.1 hypothetical protein CLM85_12835 [Streptomyces albidoflavus]PBO26503.1 hypothetical protein CLM84_31400 [Streptomyces albidoflavus]